jgi:lysozyme
MNIDKLREQLVVHEGLRLKPYRDTVGVWTIGVGRNMQANPIEDEIGRRVGPEGITRAEAMLLLRNDINRTVRDVRNNISFFDRLSEPRQHVIVDMAFNLGITGLLKFKKTLSSIEKGAYHQAAVEMLDSTWAQQVKGRARRLSDMMDNNRPFEQADPAYDPRNPVRRTTSGSVSAPISRRTTSADRNRNELRGASSAGRGLRGSEPVDFSNIRGR